MDDFESVTTGQRLDAASPAARSKRALRITGDSLEPRFPHGTTLIVEPDAKPENGRLVIATLNGEEEMLRQFAVENGVTFLRPLNPHHPATRLDDGTVICGVVVQVIVDIE